MDDGKSFTENKSNPGTLKNFQVKQAWYQKRQAQIGLSYLIGKPDRITSILIPGVFAAAGVAFVGRALHNMYLGVEKGDQ